MRAPRPGGADISAGIGGSPNSANSALGGCGADACRAPHSPVLPGEVAIEGFVSRVTSAGGAMSALPRDGDPSTTGALPTWAREVRSVRREGSVFLGGI